MNSKPVIVSIGTENYTTNISAGNHFLISDEPASLGGADAGPDPFSLLLAGIGSCTVITARMYAERKQWSLEKINARLIIENEDNDQKPTIVKEISFSGDLNEEQQNRLKEISDKCPVQKLLLPAFEFVTRIV